MTSSGAALKSDFIGRKVGNYRIEKLLGSGGMGAVYLVRHLRLPNTVAALKVLRGGGTDVPAVTQRFVQEALVAAAIGGHRVARPLDLGRFDDGAPYILMELVDGRTLGEKLQAEGPLMPAPLLGIAYRVADTMTLAHGRGIIHRDLKPSNVMLVGPDESHVKLLDFGVARAAGDLKVAETRETVIIGSPGYMSPEAASGLSVDGKSDVFSLGVVIYRMVTGALPFPAAIDRDALAALLMKPAPLASAHRPASLPPLPDGLDALIARTLSKDAADRPTMEELRDRLGELHAQVAPADSPSKITPVPTPTPEIDPLSTVTGVESDLERLRQRVEVFAESRLHSATATRERLWPLVAGATLAVALVAALGVALKIGRPARAPSGPVRAALLEQHQVTFHGDGRSFGLSPDGRTLAFSSSDRLMFLDLSDGREHEGARASSFSLPRWRPDSSALEIDFQVGAAQSQGMRVPRSGEATSELPAHQPFVFSPDGHERATARMWWKRVDISRDEGPPRALPVAGNYTWLAPSDWSADGKWILVSTRLNDINTLSCLSPDGSRQQKVVEQHTNELSARFVPGGVLYLSAHPGEADLMFVPLDDGKPAGEPRIVIEGLHAEELSVSADGKRLAYTRAHGTSELWLASIDDPNAAELKIPPEKVRRVLADSSEKLEPRLSPDGKQVAYTAADGANVNVFVADLDGGAPRRIGTEAGDKSHPSWSPDGKQLVYEVLQGGERALHVVALSGGEPRKLATASVSDSGEINWAPSPYILYHTVGNTNYRLLDPATGHERPLLDDDSHGWPFFPAWAPDGKRVSFWWNRRFDGSEPGGGLWLLALDGGAPQLLEKGSYLPMAWSADGKWLYSRRMDQAGDSLQLYKFPPSGGAPRNWLEVTIPRIGECDLSIASGKLLCSAGADSDVWLVEGFDRLLRKD